MRPLLVLALGLGLSSPPALALANEAQDAAFKAAMIYNFARFATWPPNRFASPSAPVALCVAPGNHLAPALEKLDGQAVGARRLSVRLTASMGPASHVAVLAAGASPAQVDAIQRDGALTVSDDGSPAVVRLVSVGRQTRFEIDTRAARQAGVSLSSQLLRLAVAVK